MDNRQKIITLAASFVTVFLGNYAFANDIEIGSTSLCGDNYLLELAPELLSELSWQSRSRLSRASKNKRKLPQLWDNPEVIAASSSNFILFGPSEGAYAERLGKSFQTLSWGEDFVTISNNSSLIAKKLGRPDTISTDLMLRLSALKKRNSKRIFTPKILYLSRSGGSAGKGTLVDTVIEAAGGKNILEMNGWVNPDPEIILEIKPDLIITSYFENGYESINSSAVRNKTLNTYINNFPSMQIDGALWACPGPSLIEAAELLANAIDGLR